MGSLVLVANIFKARENQDARCLHFSLSWLAHLRKAYPEFAQLENGLGGNDIAGSESDIVTFLQQKAVENKDWATLSSSLLTQAEATIESVRIGKQHSPCEY